MPASAEMLNVNAFRIIRYKIADNLTYMNTETDTRMVRDTV